MAELKKMMYGKGFQCHSNHSLPLFDLKTTTTTTTKQQQQQKNAFLRNYRTVNSLTLNCDFLAVAKKAV